MKISVILGTTAFLLFSITGKSFASESTKNYKSLLPAEYNTLDSSSNGDEDACAAVMCLMGKARGESGGSECKKHIARYFAIEKFKHGAFSGSKTMDARGNAIRGCKTANNEDIENIQKKFGAARFFF